MLKDLATAHHSNTRMELHLIQMDEIIRDIMKQATIVRVIVLALHQFIIQTMMYPQHKIYND